MKNFLILIIAIFSLCTFAAAPDASKKQTEYFRHLHEMRYVNKVITQKQYEEKLAECGFTNRYCSTMIGATHYDNKNYSEAFRWLLISSGIIKQVYNPNEYTALADRLLGEMYLKGWGVLQNYDAALKHFKICASIGSSFCAVNISLIYMKKHYLEKNLTTVRNMDEQAYAWMKISQTLFSQDNDMQIIKYFNSSGPQNFISSYERLYSSEEIKEANKIAKKLCSAIPKCMQ